MDILPFDKLVLFFNLQIMQRYRQGFLPTAFNRVWLTNEERSNNQNQEVRIVLRNHQNLWIPAHRLTSSAKQPLIKLPKTWIEFTQEDIKIIRNKNEFNAKLKNYLISELSNTVTCNRLLCPTCHLATN